MFSRGLNSNGEVGLHGACHQGKPRALAACQAPCPRPLHEVGMTPGTRCAGRPSPRRGPALLMPYLLALPLVLALLPEPPRLPAVSGSSAPELSPGPDAAALLRWPRQVENSSENFLYRSWRQDR